MKLRFIIWLSWKNLWAHRLRTALTIGGVAIGVASIVFLVSIGFGLEYLVTNQVTNFKAFTIIDVPSSNLKTGKINQEAIDKIRSISHIVSIDEVADLAARVRLTSQDSTTETVLVAADPNYLKLTDITLSKGSIYKKDSKNGVMVNKSLAGLLGYSANPNTVIGKTILVDMIIPRDLRAPDGQEGPIVKSYQELSVVGLTNGDQNPLIYMPLGLARAKGVINDTSLKVQIEDKKFIDVTRKSIENVGFSTEYIGDTIAQISQVFSLFRLILGGFGLIALAVAGLGTFNTLTISLMERIREVGLMKTLGIKRRGVFTIFIVDSLTIGMLGGLLGIIIGSAIGYGLNAFIGTLAQRAGADMVKIYYSPPTFILVVAIGSAIVGFLTGLYPAFRAIKTNALDALRYE